MPQRCSASPALADTTLTVPHPYEDGMAEQWIESLASGFADGRLTVYAVTLRTSGDLCGTVGLNLEPAHALAELGYWIGVPYWRCDTMKSDCC